MVYKRQPEIIHASELRTEITGLTHPRARTIYVVVKHDEPQFLIWPIDSKEHGSMFARRRSLLRAIQARNRVPDLPIIEAVPEPVTTVPMTTLRRNVTEFMRQISMNPVPGLITHYTVVVAIYVPVNTFSQAVDWIVALNKQAE